MKHIISKTGLVVIVSLLLMSSSNANYEKSFQSEMKEFYSELDTKEAKQKAIEKYLNHLESSYLTECSQTNAMSIAREFAEKTVNAQFESAKDVVKNYFRMMSSFGVAMHECPSEIVSQGWFDATCEYSDKEALSPFCNYTCFDWSTNQECTISLVCHWI